MEIMEIESRLARMLEAESVELVDLKLSKQRSRHLLAVFLDKTGGITLDDCAYFSDRIGALVDEQEMISGPYVLEVSSPGVDRIIKKEEDFKRFAGRQVRLRLKMPREGRRAFAGKLLGFEGGRVLLEDQGQAWNFGKEEIGEMRLNPEGEIQ